MKRDTLIARAGSHPEQNQGLINPPVYHASTVVFPSVAEMEAAHHDRFNRVFYGRYGTPTTFAFEEAVARLEGAYRAVACASGLAAIVASLLAFLKAGDHVLMVDSVYGPTRGFCDNFLARFGVETTYYDPLLGGGIAGLMRPNTRVVFLESPGSLTFEIQDTAAIAAAARAHGVVSVIDNTWASPLYFRPLEHGVDVSLHAATKYLAGHSDSMLGVLATTEAVYERVKSAVVGLGDNPGPDVLYLGLRGLRSLSVRLARHQASALEMARWLQTRPEVARVLHPALPEDPGYQLWRRDFDGASGLFGLVLKPCPAEAVAAMLDSLEHFAMGYSWGGFESLIIPTDPAKFRTATAWTAEGPCLRLHVGLEDPADLKADLERGFERLRAAAGRS